MSSPLRVVGPNNILEHRGNSSERRLKGNEEGPLLGTRNSHLAVVQSQWHFGIGAHPF